MSSSSSSFKFDSCFINYELLPLSLISFTLRPGGNDCLTFSAFSLSVTITRMIKLVIVIEMKIND